MLRITTKDERNTKKLILEGKLVGPWVEVLADCWRACKGADPVVRLELDLSEVSFVDERWARILAEMHRAGADIAGANGPYTRWIFEGVMNGARFREIEEPAITGTGLAKS